MVQYFIGGKNEHPSFFVKAIQKRKYVLINFTFSELNIGVLKL